MPEITIRQNAKALTQEGVYVTVAKLNTKQSREELIFVKERIEAGEIRAIIDRRYPLEQVAEAHRYVEAGHKKGNVIITVASKHKPEE
jgi:NADPH:quinone reductase-like Zn-dependent oxidoreductase